MANILSLAAVARIWRITLDKEKEKAIIIHRNNNKGMMKFVESEKGLYYYDTSHLYTKRPPKSKTNSAYSFVNTVANNKALYTKRQVAQAELAQKVYELVGRPSYKKFIDIIHGNQLKNCPITAEDAAWACHI